MLLERDLKPGSTNTPPVTPATTLPMVATARFQRIDDVSDHHDFGQEAVTLEGSG